MGLTLTATWMVPWLEAGMQLVVSREGTASPLKEVDPDPQSDTLIFMSLTFVFSAPRGQLVNYQNFSRYAFSVAVTLSKFRFE